MFKMTFFSSVKTEEQKEMVKAMKKLMFLKSLLLYHHLEQLFTQSFQMVALYLRGLWFMALLLQHQVELQFLQALLSMAHLLWGPRLCMVLFLQASLSHLFRLECFTAMCLSITIW